ncbi:MAG TPA: LptF/LptG family permease [Candidatus Dormibacteraeota bacterium]|nr:LptF/LptG family permease [Candidatus Dormibacteraeota bacterium]
MKTLDRYLVSELGPPTLFGLSAFTLIFVITQILNIAKLVTEEHAPLLAAVEYFVLQLPGIIVLVIPMALLLGVLLAMQRLSGDSEITALKAGGISLYRVAMPLLVVGALGSLVALFLQEQVAPISQDRAVYVREEVIKQVGAVPQSLVTSQSLPGGGRQVTAATAFQPSTQTLDNVTVIQYDRAQRPVQIIVADHARFQTDAWDFANASVYHFEAQGTTVSTFPSMRVDIGERPAQFIRRVRSNNPEEMSRSEIMRVILDGHLTAPAIRSYYATYQSKLARPFATFVFALIAIPFGLRPARGGGGSGLGFGIAIVIVFAYYVVSTVFLSVGSISTALAVPAAWAPNVIFTALGGIMLRRAGSV